MPFPLPFIPALSYKTGGRAFGANRPGGRRHAACDLIAPLDTEIFAVDEGTVIRGPYLFYNGTFALEVRHRYYTVRYGEVRAAAHGVAAGQTVSQGQVIAYVGRMHVDSMLHFEMYSGAAAGPLTQRDRPPFQRRSDLLDPTSLLDFFSNYVLASHEMP